MQTENRLFDDFAKMAGGALNMLTGFKTELEQIVRQQMEGWLANLNLVTREEFETVRQMAAKARDEQEALLARIAQLEARLGGSEAAAPVEKPKSKARKTDANS
jgi:BMFP domain-containing protein YqiC